MRKENSDFKTSFVSEAGSFLHNKDYFAYVELDDMACWVVADGLDADREADSAEMVVKSILGRFTEKPTMSPLRLKRYMQEAHEWLREESRRVRLKASLILVVTDYSKIVWAVAGHARLYHFRGGRLFGRSQDQSLAQAMANSGEISDAAVDHHAERHNLLNYMGRPDSFEPFVSKKAPLSDGDVLLLCTPGLWEEVHRLEMLDALEEAKEPEDFTDTLEDVLLSKQRGTVNNYTAVAVYVNKAFKEDPKRKWRQLKKWLIALVILAVAGGGAIYLYAKEAARKAEAAANMIEFQQNADTHMKEGDYAKAVNEYSEARNMAKRLKDRYHRDLFDKKQRLMQLMVDGDGFFKERDFAKALDKYVKAQEEAKPYKEFNHKELEEKIERANLYMQIMSWVQEGDMKFEAQDFVGARSSYQKARRAAIEEGFVDGEKEIRKKLEDAEEKVTGLKREKRLIEGDKLEKKGDQQFAAQDYVGAIDAYSAAQQIYQEIDMLERVLGMERKIDKAVDKLNPPPPAAGADGTGAGTAAAGAGQAPPGTGQAPSAAGQTPPGTGQAPSAAGQTPPGTGQAPSAAGTHAAGQSGGFGGGSAAASGTGSGAGGTAGASNGGAAAGADSGAGAGTGAARGSGANSGAGTSEHSGANRGTNSGAGASPDASSGSGSARNPDANSGSGSSTNPAMNSGADSADAEDAPTR
ncbi:PP2C family protein-serine/threonine phosphatase [Paenibacillus dendritiformis]|uniref:PP2C family protein-serine/threonine phosphatase n=1 Tax=Paenibacillus dendritiformis TaxID=130049 RepID=UPI0015608F18|nr:serine/threonine protein phosphatase [Paenibacillus dendritiformis]NRF97433.1 serine/threonine protein phosphatase [Paenibacillus dendritiformis]